MHCKLADRALAAIRCHDLLRPRERVVVAVSGGPDSMALLHVLLELREGLALDLHVAHLNHGLRGRAADDDAAFVAEQARAAGLPITVERGEPGSGSIEHAARRVRYGFLAGVARDVGASAVAVGHTADDQVETIVEGLLRGGGLSALQGMPICRALADGVRVVRPLLAARRGDVLDYLSSVGIPWREDASNADLAFERNHVRHVLLPALEERLPGLREELLATADRAESLWTAVERLGRELAVCDKSGAMLATCPLGAVPQLVRRAAVRAAYKAAGGTGDLRRRAMDAVMNLGEGGSGREVALAGGMVARRDYDSIVLTRRSARSGEVRVPLAVPGRVDVPEAGLWVEAVPVDAAPAPDGATPWAETADREQVGERLTIRTRRPGDRFEPLGLGGRKKLKDFLIDERVPRPERERQLVVTGDRGIVWVVGRRLDDRAKITPATRSFVRLRAGRLDGNGG
jgi:tRNA(Ile)-lysidine synthase